MDSYRAMHRGEQTHTIFAYGTGVCVCVLQYPPSAPPAPAPAVGEAGQSGLETATKPEEGRLEVS